MQQDRLHDIVTRIDAALDWVPEWVVALALLAFAQRRHSPFTPCSRGAAWRSLARHPIILSMLTDADGQSSR